MKKTTTIYWIITGLFAAFMLFSAIPNIMVSPESVTMITGLGYPLYFVRFIGIAKLIGVIAVLAPGLRRVKEWAYAGLFFDLVAAIYSITASGGFEPQVLVLFLPIAFLFLSYYYWHKKEDAI